MRRLAAINPIIALLIGLGWMVVKALQGRRKDADAWDQSEQPPQAHVRGEGTTPPPKIEKPGPYALPSPMRPGTFTRPPQRKETPPRPVTQMVAPTRPAMVSQQHAPTGVERAALKEAEELYARTARLDKAVTSRLAAVEQQTREAKLPRPRTRSRSPAAAHIVHGLRNPATARQAFLASFVLNPPKTLE